jgi:hypothetical protein
MNAESIFAAACLLLALTTPPAGTSKPTLTLQPRARLFLALLVVFLPLIFEPSLASPLISDDYVILGPVSETGLSNIAQWFARPIPGAAFFRPFAMAAYQWDFAWAGVSPVRWHLAGLAFHAANTVLLFFLARRLELPPAAALLAAGLFGVHGSRPEAVAWLAARFDLLATLFAFIALLLFLIFLEKPRPVILISLLAAAACGMLSKESAFSLPGLLIAVAWFRGASSPSARRAIAATFALAAAVFAYRWIVLGGIGGYSDPSGRATIAIFNPVLFLKAFALRIWAVLLFPINWSAAPRTLLPIGIAGALAAYLYIALRARRDRLVLLGLLLTVIAALPAYHLLLIGPDLEKSRVLYLGSAGFALALAALCRGIPQRGGAAAIATIIAFQTLALRHNLRIWDSAAKVYSQACDQAASPESLPVLLHGVYLGSGLPECIDLQHKR